MIFKSKWFSILGVSPEDPAECTEFPEVLLNLTTDFRDPAFLLHPDTIQMTSLASSDDHVFVPAGYLFCFTSSLYCLHLLSFNR